MKTTIKACFHALHMALVLTGVQAFAQECPPPVQVPTPEQVREAQANAKDRGLLWSLTKDGRTSYVFGTMHIGSLNTSLPGPSLIKALRATNKIVMELNLTDTNELATLQQSNKLGLAKVSMSEAQQARLEELLKENCATSDEIEQTRAHHPLMRAVGLSALIYRKRGLEAAYASEIVLLGIAMQIKREIIGLESAASQLEAIIGRDDAKAQTLFDEMIEDYDKNKHKLQSMTQRLTDDWAQSKVADLERYNEWCECRETKSEAELMTRLIEGRNVSMTERIDSLHAKGDKLLVAIGALHLIGKDGVPALLKARGYEVRQLVPAP